MTEIGERRAGVSGVGQSQIGRRIYREPLDLTLDACLAAIEDAGLDRSDIDGLSTYPGGMDQPPGFSGVAIEHVQDALRLDLNWFMGGRESPGQLGSVVNAIAAVSTGLCKHVLCFRTVTEASAAARSGVPRGRDTRSGPTATGLDGPSAPGSVGGSAGSALCPSPTDGESRPSRCARTARAASMVLMERARRTLVRST